MCAQRHDREPDSFRPGSVNRIDEAIAEARERGEFDNLPGVGQPLQIKENPLAGDWELAFHVLENAGVAPPWMEMSREIQQGLAELAAMREDAASRLTGSLPQPHVPQAPPQLAARSRFWWWPFRRQAAAPPEKAAPLPNWAAIEAERQWARRGYLEKAARVDELIAAYNTWLPDNLRRLQKPRLTPKKAAAEFDAACPPGLGSELP